MITFRASYSGNCIREIVKIALHPEPEVFDPFLHAGHTLQQTVIRFLLENNIPVLSNQFKNELEGTYVCGDKWKIVGHVDGVLADPYGLLEVKCIKDESFKKLQESSDWRGLYGNYIPQAQTYLGFGSYCDTDSETKLSGPMERTSFVFYNRNTGEVLSPLRIDHPKHTKRSDLTEYRNLDLWQQIIDKHQIAYEHIIKEEIPNDCDYGGYCFFCQRFNTEDGNDRTRTMDGKRYTSLGADVKRYRRLKKDTKQMKQLAKSIHKQLDSLEADTIRLTYPGKRGLIVKRWEFKS